MYTWPAVRTSMPEKIRRQFDVALGTHESSLGNLPGCCSVCLMSKGIGPL